VIGWKDICAGKFFSKVAGQKNDSGQNGGRNLSDFLDKRVLMGACTEEPDVIMYTK
jgi:hypothetical protein